MRATTTLSLVLSDGYALFSDPNPLPTPDHLHNWYSFWDKSLGKPVAKGATAADGTIRREFEKGTAVHNPFGNVSRVIGFSTPRKSVATGLVSREHPVAAGDGDVFSSEVSGPASPSSTRPVVIISGPHLRTQGRERRSCSGISGLKKHGTSHGRVSRRRPPCYERRAFLTGRR